MNETVTVEGEFSADETPAGASASTLADVVVIGGGGTGLAAAIEARSMGRTVILLEKNLELGGTTARSIGSISATLTPYQLRKGIKDSPRDHYEDMSKFHGKLADRPDNPALRRMLTENVPDTIRWLMSMGVEFMGPMPEPPHRRQRMHNVMPNSRAYIYHLAKAARRLGVDIRTGWRATALLRDKDGAVTGVLCEDGNGTRHSFGARGGVVLAAGDYAGSAELKARYISDAVARIAPINPTATGDGQVMGLAAGGRIVNADLTHYGIRFLPPPRRSLVHRIPPSTTLMKLANFLMERLPGALIRPFIMSFLTTVLVPSRKLFTEGALLVNKRGQIIETGYEDMAMALVDQPDQTGYIVFDATIAKKFSAWPHYISTAPGVAYAYFADYRRNRPDLFKSASSVAALARTFGADEATFVAALSSSAKTAGPTIANGPFYAFGPVKPFVNFTDGGLVVDDQLAVLDAENKPIPRLFAAGSNGQGGLLLEGHGHHLGWAFTSGRIAGRNAALLATSPAD